MYVYPLGILRLLAASGHGHIRRSGHLLNDTLLRAESRGWSRPSWCATRRQDDTPLTSSELPALPLLSAVNWTEVSVLEAASRAEAKTIGDAELLFAQRKAARAAATP
eukprot:1595053-Prymnesium_polylepis.1